MSRPVYLPTAQQELLLKAVLLPGAQAIESWTAWRALVDVDDLEIGSQRLLPGLFRNLHGLGENHADMARYKSVYRYVWVENHFRLRQAQIILDLLKKAQIPVLLLKGIALGPLYYGDLGLRPMNDLDILVPPEQAQTAAEILAAAGWQSPGFDYLSSPQYRSTNHAISCIKPGNPIELDLHWHVSHDTCWDGMDDQELWARAQDFELGGTPARTLDDTGQLFHTCVHGSRWNEVAPIRWVADATTIIAHGEIDWVWLAQRARRGQYCRRFHHVFSYLRQNFVPSIPDSFLAELGRAPIQSFERMEDLLNSRRWSPFAGFLFQFCAFYMRNPNYRATPPGFLRFMMARWGTSSVPETLIESWRRVAKHIRKSPATPVADAPLHSKPI